MLELETPTPAKLASVNVRSELHGKDNVPAVDLKFSLDASNDVLACFDGGLRSALYKREENAPDTQPTLDGVQPVSDLTVLRFPKLATPLKWDGEQTGCELVLDYGMGGKSNVILSDAKVNAFALEPKEGGTVTLGFRVQCDKGLTEKVLGKLATLVQHDVSITLTGPDGGQEDIAHGGEGVNPFGTKGAPKDATQTFLEAHG